MTTKPGATAVSKPLLLTVATAALLLAHVTTRPVSAVPAASLGVAVSCSVWPTGTVSRAGFTTTDATGGRTTATVEVSARFALVAMTLNVPAVWLAVYSPFVVIVPPVAANVALTGAEELSLYLPDTENCWVLPAFTVAVSGARMIRTSVACGTPTPMLAVPLFPSLAAVITADPAAIAVASPLALTVATAGLLLDQLSVRPESGFPLASRSRAVSGAV